MNTILRILFFLIFTLVGLGQQTIAQERPADTKPLVLNGDTVVIASDSLRNELNKLNVTFINNIVVGALQKEILNHQKQIDKHTNLLSDKLSNDSIARIESILRNEVKQVKMSVQSLEQYKASLLEAQKSVAIVITKYKIADGDYPVVYNYLKLAQTQIGLKLDSLEDVNDKIAFLLASTDQTLVGLQQLSSVATDTIENRNSLWKSQSANISKETIINNIKNNYNKSNALNRYVTKIDWGSRILLLLFCIGYGYWMFKTKYDLAKREGSTITIQWISKIVAKAVIFYFTLLPLVSLFTPTMVIQVAELIIIGLYVWLSVGELNTTQRKILAGIILFYILDVFVNIIVSEDLYLRIVCIVFNLIALAMVSYSKRKITDKEAAGYINPFVYTGFAILNITAIILNIIGHVEYSRYFSIACAVGLVQSFTLKFFIDMIRMDVQARFQRDRYVRGFLVRFNEKRTLKILVEVLTFICFIVAVFVLANNLQIMDSFVRVAGDILGKVRKIGDISFTLGNMIVAIILLVITNWLQKNISLILLGGENGELHQQYNQKMTLFPLIRLAIILIGFFIAISALGMSMDKLTVVIGALSVGIGLGMQNIINNFVSGIILVFDKPFRVGDTIELGDKKGRVKEIGIRASVLQSADGADVIIPNGDLLSGRLVNWTLTHEYGKSSFTLLVDKQADLDQVRSWIEEAALQSKHYLKNLGISISVQDVSSDMIYLSIVAWVDAAGNAGSFKSDVFLILYKRFEEAELKFYSVAPTKILQ